MILLGANNLKKAYGTNTLFEGVTFDINEKEKIALVGANGCGKTTLFKLITTEQTADGGEIYKSKLMQLGYVGQHVDTLSEKAVYDEVIEVFAHLSALEQELVDIACVLEDHSLVESEMETLVRRQHLLQERYEAGGGYTYKSRVRAALLGLGFTEAMFSLPVSVLSGGEKAKVLLSRMLLSGANLLLLDEPTNHLDIASVEWLEGYLLEYAGAVIVISHDRYFLDKVTTRTFELEHGKMTLYNGNYSFSQQKKRSDSEILKRHYDNTMREIKRIEGIVEQQRQWNRERNIKTAESKLKQIAKLEQTLEKPESELDGIRFRFACKPCVSNDIVIAKNISKQFLKPLFSGVNLNIRRGERVFLLGPNGCGKTTLLRIMTGTYASDSGRCELGSDVRTGYYDQTQSTLSGSKSVLEEVQDAFPKHNQTYLRNALAAFLFKGDDVFKTISALSGGERARVALLKLMLSEANFLLLDEPTNHLDIASREALEQALSDYEGTLFIVSHDRYFINKMANSIYRLEPEGAIEYLGNYDYYVEKFKAKPTTEQKPVEKINAYREDKERAASARRLSGQISRLEAQIAKMEELSDSIDRQLCEDEVAANYMKAMDLSKQAEQVKIDIEGLYAQWEELQTRAEESEA